MTNQRIHVYFMPGMAASPKIFENINLPKDQFEMHWLEWKIPNRDESISDYAKRMTEEIQNENCVLIGVSFGGVIVQEMSKHIKLKKLIIVSTIKSKYELPKRMRLLKSTKAYKLIPAKLLSNIDMLAKYAFGETITKRIDLYKKYLAVTDKYYIVWAIEQMVSWNQKQVLPEVIHIHGDKDPVFPISKIENCIVIKNGTHIMIINKYKWFNENLPKIILS